MSATTRLGAAASHLFGEEWAGALSRFTGISLRTCQRVKAAAEADQDHPSAEGVLAQLEDGLQQAGLMAQGGRSHVLCDDEGENDAVERGIRRLVSAVTLAQAEQSSYAFGPFLASGLGQLLEKAAHQEETLNTVALLLADALEAGICQDEAPLERALAVAFDRTRGLFGRRLDGTLDLLVAPAPLFSTEPSCEPDTSYDWLLICPAADRNQTLSLLETLKADPEMPDGSALEVYSRLIGDCDVENPAFHHYLVAKVSTSNRAKARRVLQNYGLQTNTRQGAKNFDG